MASMGPPTPRFPPPKFRLTHLRGNISDFIAYLRDQIPEKYKACQIIKSPKHSKPFFDMRADLEEKDLNPRAPVRLSRLVKEVIDDTVQEHSDLIGHELFEQICRDLHIHEVPDDAAGISPLSAVFVVYCRYRVFEYARKQIPRLAKRQPRCNISTYTQGPGQYTVLTKLTSRFVDTKHLQKTRHTIREQARNISPTRS